MNRRIIPLDTFEVPVGEEAISLVTRNTPCDLVLLQVSTNPGDTTDGLVPSSGGSYFEVNEEIYWGFNGKPLHQLFPTQQIPFFIPVTDAADISVRCSKLKSGGVRKLVVSTFKYEDEK